MKFYLVKILNYYKYDLIKENLQKHKIILTFQKDNKIKSDIIDENE